MAGEANSRDTVPNYRWGETAGGGSVSANVAEPSGGKKNTGWVPGVDGLVGEWLNWLSWAAGVFLRYLENVLGLGLTDNHVMSGAAGTEGVITAGVGLSVNVTSSRVWIDGAMYTVSAASNLALAAADPTNPRTDLIYAHLSGGIPVYAVVTGTASASLPPPTPALPAGSVQIGTARVAAAAVVPSVILSLREFGRLSLDRVIARERLDVGDVAGTPVVTISDASGLGNGITVGGVFFANPDLGLIGVDAEAVTFLAAIRRKFDLSGADFQVSGGSPALAASGDYVGASAGVDEVLAAVHIPNGGTITAIRLYGNRASNTDGLSIEIRKRAKGSGALTAIGLVDNAGTGATGDFILASTGLSESVTQAGVYMFRVQWLGGGVVEFWAAEVEWDELNPFDGI